MIWVLVDTPVPIFYPKVSTSNIDALYAYMRVVGSLSMLLILVGLIGAYSSGLQSSRWMLVPAIMGCSLLSGIFALQAMVDPVVAAHASTLLEGRGNMANGPTRLAIPIAWAILFGGGFILFGAGLMREANSSRWIGLLPSIGGMLFALGAWEGWVPMYVPVTGAILLGLGLVLKAFVTKRIK